MDFEEFFGIPKQASASQIKEAVKEKQPELDKLLKRGEIPQEQQSLISSIEKLCVMPSVLKDPRNKEKEMKEESISITEVWKELAGLKS